MSSSSSEEDVAEARRRLVARALQARAQPDPVEESSESSSDSSESSDVRLKPMFVPKNQRLSVQEREARLLAESAAEEHRRAEEEAFALRQKELALQQAAIEDTEAPAEKRNWWGIKLPEIGMEDTEEEYQKWKLRELKRILYFRTGKWDVDEETAPEERKERHKGAFYRS